MSLARASSLVGLLIVAVGLVPAEGFGAALRPAGLITLRHGLTASVPRVGVRVAARAPLGLVMSEGAEEELEMPKQGKLRRLFGFLRRVGATTLSKVGNAIMGDDEDFVPMDDDEDDFEHYDAPAMSEEQLANMKSMVTSFSRHSMSDIQTQMQATQTRERDAEALPRREMKKPIVSREQQQQLAQQNAVNFLADTLAGVPDVTTTLFEAEGAVEEEGHSGEKVDAEKLPTRA
eukprot:CAMPEP_0206231196 /NCGR_PEP_ID=MMETSP0047_2-20121206/10701_1 /ASSEMBLY_ACC=CAM_ASM_000192 /TAXON_ID=195065 /ORGANISM="Chroomonas mesostigmatica_cf, Strain CCMP1168" /LENGTH=232 /DNA_ID=CAMNT_0053654745 /DNA_START=307 /DNA_END=1005 /DNA_ORIENTATION=+